VYSSKIVVHSILFGKSTNEMTFHHKIIKTWHWEMSWQSMIYIYTYIIFIINKWLLLYLSFLYMQFISFSIHRKIPQYHFQITIDFKLEISPFGPIEFDFTKTRKKIRFQCFIRKKIICFLIWWGRLWKQNGIRFWLIRKGRFVS
jgi:hypothetical protein